MATDLYAGFTNPNAGETFRCISNNAEAFVFEWIVQPGGHLPNPHIHFTQDELFHIKSGDIRSVLDGQEHIVKAGSTTVNDRHVVAERGAGEDRVARTGTVHSTAVRRGAVGHHARVELQRIGF